MPVAFEAVSKLDIAGAVEDSLVALEHLRELPEVDGPAGVLGFCLGGSLAFSVAAEGDPAIAVSYYGSTVADSLGERERIGCPMQFHFGAQDPYIPLEQAELVAAAAARRPDWECHIQGDAGHAFDNHESEMFHRPEAAARAWERTSEFLARELPTSARRRPRPETAPPRGPKRLTPAAAPPARAAHAAQPRRRGRDEPLRAPDALHARRADRRRR